MTLDATEPTTAAVPPEAEPGETVPPGTEAEPATEAAVAVPLRVSDAALESVLGIRAEEPDAEALALRVAITGSKGREYTYDLSFASADEVAADDVVFEVGDLRVAVAADSVDRLRGAELDLPRTAGQGGLVIRNPNTPDPFEGIAIELTGELPDKVAQLLDERVNPMLASHGGYAQFVGVDDDNNVYVTMGGGCQGCAASAATLRDGIRTAIMDAIPEVVEVIDTTDHAAGENPFY